MSRELSLLPIVRIELVHFLWERYKSLVPAARRVEERLKQEGEQIVLDHLTLFDLPGPERGLPLLAELFELLGFEARGTRFSAAEGCEYLWLAERDHQKKTALEVLPQIVLGSFPISGIGTDAWRLLSRLRRPGLGSPLLQARLLAEATDRGDEDAARDLLRLVCDYLTTRDYALPTHDELVALRERNELLAATLVDGRDVRSFGLAVHYLGQFASLEAFLEFVQSNLELRLQNRSGEMVRGGPRQLIAESVIEVPPRRLALAGGESSLPDRSLSLVWRYSRPLAGKIRSLRDWDYLYQDFAGLDASRPRATPLYARS